MVGEGSGILVNLVLLIRGPVLVGERAGILVNLILQSRRPVVGV